MISIKDHLSHTLLRMKRDNIDRYSMEISKIEDILLEFEVLNNKIKLLEENVKTLSIRSTSREINGGSF